MAQAVSKQAAKEEVARHKEREDARWQVMLRGGALWHNKVCSNC